MPYFLSPENLTIGKLVQILPPESGHILLAHRVKKGEKIKLQGPDGKRFLCEVKAADKKSLSITPLEILSIPEESPVQIILFQSAVSEKALDFIFQKGTELGVNKIILFNSANIAAKLSVEKFKAKHDRWNRILIEAAKQCERGVWPELEFLSGMDEVLVAAKKLDKIFLADIGGIKLSPLTSSLSSSLGLLIGPEGGFTEEEVYKFRSLSNLEIISLGPTVLRAETAALAALAILRLTSQ